MKRNGILAIATLAIAFLLEPAIVLATDEKSVAQELADELQELTVRAKLVDQLGVEALRISVRVSGKTAVLTGTVPKRAIKELAPDVALSVKGITIVENEVALVETRGTAEKAESKVMDTALEIKVKSALLSELGRNAMDINVEAADGVVVLRGEVRSAEISQLAEDRASKIKGVKKVVNILES